MAPERGLYVPAQLLNLCPAFGELAVVVDSTSGLALSHVVVAHAIALPLAAVDEIDVLPVIDECSMAIGTRPII